MYLTGKRVTVIGLSESGFSAAKLLRRVNAKVRISELRSDDDMRNKLKALENPESETGGHTEGFIRESDIIVISPGVSLNAEPLRWVRGNGIPIIGELELGCMFTTLPIIAVTGTNGKSTTVSLLHELLKADGKRSYLLGNIGRPICEDILDLAPDSMITLEVSSFQLETIKTFRPKIAVLLNITQDHLDRYRDMNEYRDAKLRVFENQGSHDYAILNFDDPFLRNITGRITSKIFYFSRRERVKGAYLEDAKLWKDNGKCYSKYVSGQELSH